MAEPVQKLINRAETYFYRKIGTACNEDSLQAVFIIQGFLKDGIKKADSYF